ncbi:vasodilator-stimulated phosphoprotein-like [Moschus berezovskii]|uniref:vasodilator-stimulated phosphoprotein-like n=1 Tax=Moschus berezovskii TaxID=68408 RepID=UPI002443D650|nr:vasodilator-stimulated phosphoprotein-like [Moschus berezovskii]
MQSSGLVLERPLDANGESIAELARRSLRQRPVRSQGRRDQGPTAAAAHGGQPSSGTGAARRQEQRGARPRGPRAARPPPLPAPPPPPLPARLPQVSTNGNGSRSAEDQRKQNTEAAAGGPRGGRRPRNGAGPRGPALPSSPAAALTRSGFGPVAPARAPEPAEKRSGAGSTCSVFPEQSGRRVSPRRFLSGPGQNWRADQQEVPQHRRARGPEGTTHSSWSFHKTSLQPGSPTVASRSP